MSSTNQERENQFNKCLKEFLKYRSSSYEVKKKIDEFNAVGSRFRNNDFSFVTHAAGIWFLHLPDIENAYNEKRKNLCIFKAHFNYGILEDLINKSAQKMAEFNSSKEDTDAISDKIFYNLEEFFIAVRDGKLEDFFARFCIGQIGTGFNPVYALFRDSEKLKIEWEGTSPDFSFVKSGNENLAVKFYSDLRLLNEIEKNRMEQVKVNTLRRDFKEIEWKYPGNTNIKIECKVNDFSQGSIHTVSRSIVVSGISTYENICRRTDLDDTDKISSSFTDRSSQLTDFQAKLHFLLFGAEVMRNPSALIHNMMMLDLIKSWIPRKESTGVGSSDMESTSTEVESAMKRTWYHIYGNHDFIPMGRYESERAARFINDEYNNYMPHKYSFDTTFEDFVKLFSPDQQHRFYQVADTIINKEWIIIESWLKMKFGEEKFREICNEDRSIFFGILKKALKEWYNVNIY